jgi:NAD(P)H-flavin reductase
MSCKDRYSRSDTEGENVNAMLPIDSKILAITKETGDIKSFLLENVLDKDPRPGQFYELSVLGYGEVPISIASCENELLFTVKRVGKVTEKMHKMVKGDRIGIRGPYGFGFPEPGKGNIVIAGGVGLPPARSFIEHSLAIGNKNIILLYGARSPSDIAYKKELEKWAKIFTVHVTVDVGDNTWNGNIGVVTKLFNRISNVKAKFIIIGPPIMIKFSVLELQKIEARDEDMYLSLERKMKCGIGICGHCNISRFYVCKDGPVFPYSKVKDIPELFF